MTLIPLAVITAVLFFIFLPAVFSLHALFEYRRIRHAVVRSTVTGFLSTDSKDGEFYRCFGTFDGFKDNNEIWVRTDNVLVKVNMNRGRVISVPEKVNRKQRGFWGGKIPGSLKIIKWKKLNTLASGARLFLFGRVRSEGSLFCLDAEDKDSLVVLYEGDSEGLDRELVVQAKSRYTYFQSSSLSVLVLGALSMCLLSVFEYRISGFSFLFFIYLLTAAVPVLFFVPPGCLLLLLSYNLKYKVFLLRHDYYFHYFSKNGEKPNAVNYWRKLWLYEISAVAAAGGAAVINFVFFMLMLYFLVL